MTCSSIIKTEIWNVINQAAPIWINSPRSLVELRKHTKEASNAVMNNYPSYQMIHT